MRNITAIFLF
jgi:hypothetical protein